jgi:hypothetical protein
MCRAAPGARVMSLAGLERNAFVRDGYAVVRGVLPVDVVERVGSFLADGESTALAMIRDYAGLGAEADVRAACDDIVRRDAATVPKEIRDVAMGHFPLATRLSERLWDIARVDALGALIRECLADERVFMHVPPVSRYVVPESRTAGVPAHQDRSYNGHLPSFITVWVPYVSIDERCGGVIVYEGGDRAVRELTPPSGPWLGACSTEGLRAVQPALDPGDVLVLSDWIVHASAPNRAEHTRISTDFRFFAGGRSKKHALDLATFTVIPPEANG